jgi:tryptophanyl-tRNA synthetase
MHTSYKNAIFLKDTPGETYEKIMKMYTDPNRIHAHDPGTVTGNPVFIYHDVFNSDKDEVADLKDRYLGGKVGDVEVKKILARALTDYLEPLRTRRAELAARPQYLLDILQSGTNTALPLVQSTLTEVHDKMGLISNSIEKKDKALLPNEKVAADLSLAGLSLIP